MKIKLEKISPIEIKLRSMEIIESEMGAHCSYRIIIGRNGGSRVAAAICNSLSYQIYVRSSGEII